MSAAHRLAVEWFDQRWGADMIDGEHFDHTDLEEAFAAGFGAAMNATWEPGGQSVHPGHPENEAGR